MADAYGEQLRVIGRYSLRRGIESRIDISACESRPAISGLRPFLLPIFLLILEGPDPTQ